MATDGRGLGLTALVAVGAAAAVFACLPSVCPNPLPEGSLAPAALPQLRRVAAALDAACARGDLGAFVTATTDSHRDELRRRLLPLDLALDGATLRAFGADGALAAWLDRPLLAGAVRGDRIVVAVLRSNGDGAQVLAFVWNGQRLCFDGSCHAVAVTDRAGAALRVAAGLAAR